jgi:hypothetical protein
MIVYTETRASIVMAETFLRNGVLYQRNKKALHYGRRHFKK